MSSSGTYDNELVARVVAQNDTAAYGELVHRHQSQVRNFLRKLTGDTVLADDLAQDCFMHAWGKLHTFVGYGSFVGWLLKVAYTTFLQSKRKSQRYDYILQQLGHSHDTEQHSSAQQCYEITDLDRFLAVLTEQERAVMILSYGCGLSHREIANTAGLPVGTVKSIIFRGKEKIRERFEFSDNQYG